MYEYDLPTYILSIIAIAIAVERTTEFIKDSSLVAPLRVFIFRAYAFLSIRSGEDTILSKRIDKKCDSALGKGIFLYFAFFVMLGIIAEGMRVICAIIRLPFLIIFWFLHSLLKCGFCLSGQLSTWFAIFAEGELFEMNALDNWFIKAGLIWGLSNYIHTLYEVHRRGRVQALDITIKESDEEHDEDDVPTDISIDDIDSEDLPKAPTGYTEK